MRLTQWLCCASLSLVFGGHAFAQDSRSEQVDSQGGPPAENSAPATTWLEPVPLNSHALGSITGSPVATFLNTGTAPEGDAPDDVVFTPDGTQVLVVHRDTDNVVFFDVNTRTATHTVPVGDFPTDVAVTPNGQYAVTPNVFGNSVSIIDIASHTAIATVPITGTQPYRVAITPDSQFAVVGVINDAVNSAFSVVDLTTQSEVLSFSSAGQGVIGFFATPESGSSGPLFTQFILSADGNSIILPHRAGSQVIFYDRATGAVQAALPTVAGPTSIDLSDDGTLAVVGHDSPGNAITKIDAISRLVTGSFPTPTLDGQVIRVTPDKSHAIAGISNNIIFVNLTTGVLATQIMTGVVGDIEISFDGQYAFVSNFNARVIHIPSRTLAATIPFAACVESATSPTQLRAVAINSRFREDVHFYSINGASSFLEGFAPTGQIPEGDAARNLALSSDGQTLVVCHNISRNVAVIDVATKFIRAYVDVGDRPLAARVTPNNNYAVVCATDANMVRVVDLASNAIVASLGINTRPAQVRISPDSQWAYVLNVAGVDMVSFIQLNGPASRIVTQVSSGLQAGSALGYAYTEISGIELSADGSVLAVCDSFNDFLRLYDTVTRTQVAQVPVGDFPIRVAFNPAGTRAYVANSFSDNLSVVNVNGGASSVVATVPGIEFPLTVDVDQTGSFVYVGNTHSTAAGIHVISTASHAQVGFVSLASPARETHYSADEDVLYAALNNGTLARIDAAGAASSVIDTVPLSAGPSDLVFDEATRTAIAAQPIPDGVDFVQYLQPCLGDVILSGTVDVSDLLAVISAWGPCPDPNDCPADIDGDDVVGVIDLLAVINAWGPCP